MHEEICQGTVHPVTNEPTNTGSVILFPFWIDREWNFSRPARQSAAGQQDRVTKGFISTAPFVEHSGKHGNIQVRVVINTYFAFALVETVKSPHILGNRSAPRNRQGQE